MARPLRIDIENGLYHVTSRGWQRRVMVRKDADCQHWLELLDRVALRCGWRVFAWMLMTNHWFISTCLGLCENPVWLDCLAVLGQFGKPTSRARVAYRGFVESGMDGADCSPLAAAAGGVLLGSEGWVEKGTFYFFR